MVVKYNAIIKNDAHRHKPIKAITLHPPHSRNRVVGNGGDVELRKIQQEISLSLSSMFFENKKLHISNVW